jgi:hypothetical protein
MGVKDDPKLDETLRTPGAGNAMPTGEAIEPRRMGATGVRMVLDQLLSGVDGLGREQLDALGIDPKELTEHRDAIEQALLAIIREDYRRPQRRQAVAAALRLAGHLRMRNTARALTAVLEAQHNPPTLRAAAADALGLMRAPDAERVLLAHLDDPQETVARAAGIALGKIGTTQCLDELRRRALSAENLALQRSLYGSVRAIEEQAGMPPSLEEWQKPERAQPQRTRVTKLELDARGELSSQPSDREECE